MANWITDRTQSDVDEVEQLFERAKAGTWTEEEQAKWAAGMKGALSYTDFNRIESGIQELSGIVGATVSVKTDWLSNGYLTVSDAARWLVNINAIRSKCSGMSTTPAMPSTTLSRLTFSQMNQLEQILFDVETLAGAHMSYSGEVFTGGDEYGFC